MFAVLLPAIQLYLVDCKTLSCVPPSKICVLYNSPLSSGRKLWRFHIPQMPFSHPTNANFHTPGPAGTYRTPMGVAHALISRL